MKKTAKMALHKAKKEPVDTESPMSNETKPWNEVLNNRMRDFVKSSKMKNCES